MSNEQQGAGYGKPPVDTQFQKGQSGNPSGRPAGSISSWLKFYGSMTEIDITVTMTDTEGKKNTSSAKISTDGKSTINQLVAARGLQKAIKGDFQFWREVLNRTEGRVPQPINLGGQADNPLMIDDIRNLTPDELTARRSALRRRIADERAGEEGL
jgi:hypothetical protein